MEQSIKTEIRDQIFKKIENLQREPQTVKKFFPFTAEDLNKDPEGCIEVIEDYLEQHKDKILDFEFESWMDESVMIPVIMLKMKLLPEISKFLIGNVVSPPQKSSFRKNVSLYLSLLILIPSKPSIHSMSFL